MTRTIEVCLLCACLVVAGSAVAYAGPDVLPREPRVNSRAPAKATANTKAAPTRTQRLTFGEDVVEAGRAAGHGSLVKGQVAATLKKLIRIRTDFISELLKSADNL